MSEQALSFRENTSHTNDWTTMDKPEFEDVFSYPCKEEHHPLAQQIQQADAIGLSTLEWFAVVVFGPCGDGALSRAPGLRLPQSVQLGSPAKAPSLSKNKEHEHGSGGNWNDQETESSQALGSRRFGIASETGADKVSKYDSVYTIFRLAMNSCPSFFYCG